jgi:hypothetical protein
MAGTASMVPRRIAKLMNKAKGALSRKDIFFKLTRNLEVIPEGWLRVSKDKGLQARWGC